MRAALRVLTLIEQPGMCRWCGCTEAAACEGGCSWANRAATLCSECVPIDTMIRTRRGRRELAVLAADAQRERERQAAAEKAARKIARARAQKRALRRSRRRR